MWAYLFDSIELFSNHKSFSLGVDTTRNLWLLLHFKDLEIKNKTIYYQIDNGIRQRKNTKHPIRKMHKLHKNTAELIEYLSDKPYNIIKLELEFTNGWAIKQLPYIELRFYTNSTKERDGLINRLLNLAGRGPIDVSQIEINYSYYFKSANDLVKISPKGPPHPDEFWSEEKIEHWSKQQRKLELQKSGQDYDKKDYQSQFKEGLRFKSIIDKYPPF
jgi:hypothetical protein